MAPLRVLRIFGKLLVKPKFVYICEVPCANAATAGQAGGTLTASAELNAEKTNLTLNCYWISVHYFSPIFWKFPKKLRSIFILQKLEKRTKIQQLLKEKMVVDKTQFGKYRKRSELDAENRNAKKIAEICCAKFWELNV